jgi:hypothetical protein
MSDEPTEHETPEAEETLEEERERLLRSMSLKQRQTFLRKLSPRKRKKILKPQPVCDGRPVV